MSESETFEFEAKPDSICSPIQTLPDVIAALSTPLLSSSLNAVLLASCLKVTLFDVILVKPVGRHTTNSPTAKHPKALAGSVALA
jgi:hypothetical protein